MKEILSVVRTRREQLERDKNTVHDPDRGHSYYQPEDPISILRSLEFEIRRRVFGEDAEDDEDDNERIDAEAKS